jgi:catechol 2,3-dioxygenase-like lactoylglutathione lyase family enzyme
MIKSAEHFSFTVSDIESALHFFCDLLGLSATSVAEVETPEVRQIVGIPDASLRISTVKIPGGTRLELIQYVRPSGRKVDTRPFNPGTAHIAFLVDDIQTTYEDLLQKGVKFVNPPVWNSGNDGKGRWGVSYLHGPDNLIIELIEQGRTSAS